jgi:fermentation-respiration switch protein FrsA (DUF1100 family)
VVTNSAIVRIDGPGALFRPSPLEVVDEIAPRPLLLMHGTADPVIPFEHSERLHAAAGEPSELWILEGARHAALFDHDPAAYREKVMGFLERHLMTGGEEARSATP